jgi:hypothetical protein
MKPKEPKKYEPPLSLYEYTLEEVVKRVGNYKPQDKKLEQKVTRDSKPKQA